MHIHSTYSFDGKISLSELVEVARHHGHRFAILTEHAEGMSREQMKRLVAECAEASGGDFLLIPGLEVICRHNLHILALGVTEYLSTTEPARLVEEIHDLGGLAVLAHPGRKLQAAAASKLGLDGVEIWNARHDGRLVPSMRSIKLLRKLVSSNGHLTGCCGLDLHERRRFTNLHVAMRVRRLTAREVLENIKTGEFVISNSIISIDPLGDLSMMEKAVFTSVNCTYRSAKLLKIATRKILRHVVDRR